MNYRNIFLVVFMCVFSCAGFVYSIPTITPDSRSSAMGATFVGIGEDSMAQYYNPAGLDNSKGFGLQIYLQNVNSMMTRGFDYILNSFIAYSTGIASINNVQSQGKPLTLSNIHTLAQFLKLIKDTQKPGKGILLNASAGALQCNIGAATISFNPCAYMGMQPDVDLSDLFMGQTSTSTLGVDFSSIGSPVLSSATLSGARDNITTFVNDLVSKGAITGPWTTQEIANGIINQAVNDGNSATDIINMSSDINEIEPLLVSLFSTRTSTSTAFLDNQSGVTVKGLGILEFSIGYGSKIQGLEGTFLEGLEIGGNIKYLTGYAIYKKVTAVSIKNAINQGTVLFEKTENTEQSSTIGLDIGFLLDRKKDMHMKFGLALKNINTPKFKPPLEAQDNNEKFELSPSARLGFSFWPADFMVLATDIDLFRIPTFINTVYSQMMSAGVEINVPNKQPFFNVALRAGIRKNIAEMSVGEIYSAGLGFSFATFNFDVGAALNTDKINLPQSLQEKLANQNIDVNGLPSGFQFSTAISFRFK